MSKKKRKQRAFDRVSGKPAMTQREANYRAHQKGAEAAEETRRNPSQEEGKALMSAGAREKKKKKHLPGGLELQPLSLGIHYVLEKIGSRYLGSASQAIGLDEIVFAAYAFANSERAYDLVCEQEDVETFEKEARKFSLRLTRETLGELNEYINSEFAAFGMAAEKPSPLVAAQTKGQKETESKNSTASGG